MLSVGLNRDILAIRCVDHFIIISVGNQLHIFNQLTLDNVSIIDTFHNDCIHEIIKTSNKLIAFGGKHLSIFQFELVNDTIELEKIFTHRFNDWIIAAKFLSNTDEVIAILFAHNNLHFFNRLTLEYENIWCEEKCILYGGCLSNQNANEVVIFSGTVFREILIWKGFYQQNSSSDSRILHTLKGHKGVIFSVFYDPLKGLIASTSDDRTVKLWQIKEDSNYFSNLEKAKIVLKNTLFSHTARVWRSAIVNDLVISIGEDSLLCIWSLEGELCNKIPEAHDGAVIWSVDASENKSTIFTGGADGAVNSWPLIYTHAAALTPVQNFENRFTPKYVCFLTSGYLAFMDGGRLLKYDENSPLPKDSIDLQRYENYCLMQLDPSRNQLAFASKDGHVDIIQDINKKFQSFDVSKKVIESMILSLHWLNNYTLLICGSKGCLKILKITKDKKIEVKSECILPPSKERWTTAAILVKNSLICGDRTGNVFLYSIFNNKFPIQILSKVHRHSGVQSFELYEGKLLSTGRDGTLKFYKGSHNSFEGLQVLHQKKMPMAWVCKTIKTDNDLFVVGFKEIEFMIYSTRLNRLVLKIVCGGGHRSWDCVFSNNFINFICVRNKQVFKLENEPCSFSDTLIPGYHTKEILTLQALPGLKDVFISGSEDCTLRIGMMNQDSSGRYKLKPLETYDGHISNVKSVALINLEESSCRSRNLVFSGGGRAQLNVWEVDVNVKTELSRDDFIVTELISFMLRKTDKNRKKNKLNQNEDDYFTNPETRLMDISIYRHSNDQNLVILFIACSDGFLRIFIYNLKENCLTLSTAIPYLNRCILKLCNFVYEDEVILISMATDGIVNFWSMNCTIDQILSNDFEYRNLNLEPVEKWRIHQSGINSYDLKRCTDNQYLLASGGDDNKINLSVFTLSKDSSKNVSIYLASSWNSSTVHTAQITGIKFVNKDYLISAALDQRVVLYKYSLVDSVISVEPIKTVSSFIADIQGTTIFSTDNEKLICIYGQGIEILKI